MAFDLVHRSASNVSLFTRTPAKSRGGWRENTLTSYDATADIEPTFTEPYFEAMETRLLLDVSATEFEQIRTLYPELHIGGSMSQWDVIEITADNLTDRALRDAISAAGTTTKLSLIVIRTTQKSQTITLTNGQVSIYTNVSIVSLGPVPLTIDANKNSRVFYLGSAADVTLSGLTLTNGSANFGGAIYNAGGQLAVTTSTLIGNSATYGGAIYCDSIAGTTNTYMWVTNSLLTNNTADYGGGLFYTGPSNARSSFVVENATITGNTAIPGGGGGIYVDLPVAGLYETAAYHRMHLSNSIVAENKSSNGSTVPNDIVEAIDPLDTRSRAIYGWSSLTTFTRWYQNSSCYVYSNSLPLFINAAAGNYQLAAGSQAIDKGNDGRAEIQGLTTNAKDLAGNPRVVNGRIDLGAYEYQSVTRLTAPTGISATGKNASTITVGWNTVTNASGYIIQYATDDGFTQNVKTQTVPGGTSRTADITGLASGTQYYVRVMATGTGNYSNSLYSSPANATTTGAHTEPGEDPSVEAPPTSVAVKAIVTAVKAKADGYSAIVLTWKAPKVSTKTAPAGMTLVGYNIYGAGKNATATPIAFVAAGDAMSYRVTGLSPKTAYSYRIVAVYQQGDGGEETRVESSRSVMVKTKTKKFAAPKAVKAARGDIGLTSITLQWKPVAGADDVRVECSLKKAPVELDFTPETGNAVFLYNGDGQIVGVTITGLKPGTKYRFAVYGINTALEVESSAMKKSVKTQKFPASKKPSLVKSKSSLRLPTVDLTWKTTPLPKGMTSGTMTYEIFVSETKLKSGAAGWTQVPPAGEGGGISVTFTATGATLTGLTAGKTYYFYIRSFLVEDPAAFSNSAVLKIKTPL